MTLNARILSAASIRGGGVQRVGKVHALPLLLWEPSFSGGLVRLGESEVPTASAIPAVLTSAERALVPEPASAFGKLACRDL
jgi:hypothetical protein